MSKDVAELEKELAALVALREVSVGVTLKRTNFEIAMIQNTIATVEKKRHEAYVSRRELVAEELAWAKTHLSLEDYLDIEFHLLGVKPHIKHLKQDSDCAYSFVTVATPRYETYQDIRTALWKIYLEGAVERKTGSDLDALLVLRFSEFGWGVAPCHAGDNFSRKLGRIISEGRLYKLLRKERLER